MLILYIIAVVSGSSVEKTSTVDYCRVLFVCLLGVFFWGGDREVKQDPLFRQYEFFYCLIFSTSKTSALLDLEGPLEFHFFVTVIICALGVTHLFCLIELSFPAKHFLFLGQIIPTLSSWLNLVTYLGSFISDYIGD